MAPRLYRLARLREYITPCCYIRERFSDSRVTSFVTGCYLIPMAIYVLAQIKSISTLMAGLTGSKSAAFASTGVLTAIMLLYESLGGLKSVAWTDVAQVRLLSHQKSLVVGSTLSHCVLGTPFLADEVPT